MITVNIKPKNLDLIHRVAQGQQPSEIYGIKYHALYKLIQKKGHPMETEDKLLNGVKALEYMPGHYIAIKRDLGYTANFYPCRLRTIHLQAD